MTQFIQCPVRETTYRGEIIKNSGVNISRVNTIFKSRLKWYPDNDGIPKIVFCGTKWVAEWVYNRNQEKLRDQHYELLISNQFDAFLPENVPVRTIEEKDT